MPSWPNSESSTEMLNDLTDMDYCPDTCDDPSFHGLAVGCPEVCRVHKLEPLKCVAFEGSNTGRRFYMCSLGNQVNNCGFHSWLDNEWPETMKNALGRLWSMYEESNNARIEEKIESAKLLKEVNAEKIKAEKKYTSLMVDVDKFMRETERNVWQENHNKMMVEGGNDDGKNTSVVDSLKNEVSVLKNAVSELKQVLQTQGDVMKAKKKEAEEEKAALKEEKKKLEYMLYDLIKAGDANKGKINKIKAIIED